MEKSVARTIETAVDDGPSIPLFTDAHIHFWDRALLRYPWLEKSGGALPASFLPGDADALGARNAAAVVVQADCRPQDGLAEAAWLSDLIRSRSAAGAVVAFAPVEDLASLGAHLEALGRIDLVAGVRRLLQDEPDELLRSAALASGLRAVTAAGLVFDACVRHHQLPALLSLRRAVPEARIVLDHLGKPPVRDGWGSPPAQAWLATIRLLAAEPRTTVKLSGLVPEAGPGPVLEQVRPFLEAALEAFGADRSMIGSDFPVSGARPDGPSYLAWFRSVADLASHATEREALLIGTAAATYGTTSGDR